jgi:hypothetical protein
MARTTTGAMVLYVMPDSSVRPALVVGVDSLHEGMASRVVFTRGQDDFNHAHEGEMGSVPLVVYRADVRYTQYTPPRTPGTWHTLAENSQDKAEED